jgi:hypothetical protein
VKVENRRVELRVAQSCCEYSLDRTDSGSAHRPYKWYSCHQQR